MLSIKQHELLLKQILGAVFRKSQLQGTLGFKGGTCLYIFYELNRFSTDLDFNLISDQFNPDDMSQILETYLRIEDFHSKHNTWFWLGSYEKGFQKVKIDISKREFPDKYILKEYLGITMQTMAPEYMLAHKLCAITNRTRLQNRDLYDAWFMFSKMWEPNRDIVKLRTGLDLEQYYAELINFIEKKDLQKGILEGLGEVLNESLKDWVRVKLIEELLFQLRSRL